jgi:DNA-binding transcriptional LysR family regulator
MDKLVSMRVFTQVVETGSFVKAAGLLGISRAMATKHVMELENVLGARLLNRTTRRLSLTEAGTAYFQSCAQILAEIEDAEQVVSGLSAEPRGTLRINAPMSFGILHLAPAVVDFSKLYPDVHIDLTLNDRFVDLIEEGFDIAIRIAQREESSLITRKLTVARIVVCGSPDYLAEHGAPQTPAALLDHRCLSYAYWASQKEWRFQGPDGPHVVRIASHFQANNGDVIRLAVLRGLGLALLPTFIAGDDLKAGRLRIVLPEYQPPELAIHAVYPHRRHLSAKVRNFIDFLADRFAQPPYWDDWDTGSNA